MHKIYKGYIYLYINKINGKKYVGQTIDFKQRCARHRNCTDLYIDQAINKYGIDNFKIIILEVFTCDSLKARNIRLDYKEIYGIEKLHSYGYDYPNEGYNLTKGGSCPGERRKRNAKIHKYDYTSKEDFEKARYQIRKEEIKEYGKKYREIHREELRLYQQEFRNLHKDEINTRRRELRKLNKKLSSEEQKEKNRLAQEKYRKNHPDRIKDYAKKYYKKLKESMTDEEREKRKEYRKQGIKDHPEYEKERYKRRKAKIQQNNSIS